MGYQTSCHEVGSFLLHKNCSNSITYHRSEYITIASIIVVMTVWDFVVGVLFGIVVSCKKFIYTYLLHLLTHYSIGFFFVVQNSQRRSIRAIHTGETAMSTVRRPGAHRAYIREVSRQTMIVRLQGIFK